jgi:hypothetical protein
VDEERRFCLRGELPAADGAIVARALERATEQMPNESTAGEPISVEARLADALVGVCSARLSADPAPARATVVIHAQLEGPAPASAAAR